MFLHINEAIFDKERVSERGEDYVYGKVLSPKKTSAHSFYNRVMTLALKPISREPMGGDKFIYNVLGLTPDDLMQFDFASLVDLEERIETLRADYEKEAQTKHDLMNKGQQNG